MAARANIVETYAESNSEQRLSILIKHFSYWDGILDASIYNLVEEIMAEIARCRREAIGDLGVRVQTSRLSDPTTAQGDNEMLIKEAVVDCNFAGGILSDIDDPEPLIIKACTIRDMRKDRSTFNAQFGYLAEDERVELKEFLSGKKSIEDFSKQWGIEYMSAYRKLEKLRNIVKEQTLVSMKGRRAS